MSRRKPTKTWPEALGAVVIQQLDGDFPAITVQPSDLDAAIEDVRLSARSQPLQAFPMSLAMLLRNNHVAQRLTSGLAPSPSKGSLRNVITAADKAISRHHDHCIQDCFQNGNQ